MKMGQVSDVMQAASKAYKLLLENDKVRVMEIRLKPGEKAPMHNHPNNHVVYVMKDTKFKLSFADGKSGEFDLKAGQTLWMEAGSHETENIGKADGHNLIVELKKS
jgi:beta-alanine degradation protein BauB